MTTHVTVYIYTGKTTTHDAALCSGVRQLEYKDISKYNALRGILPPIHTNGKRKVVQNRYVKPAELLERLTNERMTAYNFQQIPAKQVSILKSNVIPPLQTRYVNGRHMAIKQQKHNKPRSSTKKKTTDRLHCRNGPINMDVIKHRAQWPPFNTYMDKEASARYQRLITGFSSEHQ